MNYREEMREFIKSPRDGSSIHYGKWCALNREQTDYITRLLDEMDRADDYIKKLFLDKGKLQDENKQLKDNWNKLKKELKDKFEEYRYVEDECLRTMAQEDDSILFSMKCIESGDSNE